MGATTSVLPRWGLAAVMVLALVGQGWGQVKGGPPLPEATTAWLKANAVEVATLDMYEDRLDDLAPLKEMLRDARIVLLGEQSHQDGATFRAKARLVRFLHQEMGFEVLAFESGLYECDRANKLLVPGKDVRQAMYSAVFPAWQVAEALPVFEYAAWSGGTPRPLLLAGFDLRLSGSGAANLMPRLLAFLGTATRLPTNQTAWLMGLDEAVRKVDYAPDEATRGTSLALLAHLRDTFDQSREHLERRHGARETEFYSRVLDNLRAYEQFWYLQQGKKASLRECGNLRDAQMADNIRWLAEQYYPDKKLICWCATYHAMHGLQGITNKGRPAYVGTQNMGSLVREHFGPAAYVVGFTAHHGQRGAPFAKVAPLPTPAEGSLEDLLHRYGAPLLFVNLRQPGPFSDRLLCSALGYAPMEASWPEVFDGLFFTDEMTPSSALQ